MDEESRKRRFAGLAKGRSAAEKVLATPEGRERWLTNLRKANRDQWNNAPRQRRDAVSSWARTQWAKRHVLIAEAARLKNLEGIDVTIGLRSSLAAHLLLGGGKPYAIAPDIYPESTDPHNAMKTFMRRWQHIVDVEKRRICKLAENVRRAEVTVLTNRLRIALKL